MPLDPQEDLGVALFGPGDLNRLLDSAWCAGGPGKCRVAALPQAAIRMDLYVRVQNLVEGIQIALVEGADEIEGGARQAP